MAVKALAQEATKLGSEVYSPVAEGGRYRPHLRSRRGDELFVQCASSWRKRDGFVHRPYTSTEIDAVAAYSMDLERCYFVPIERVEGRPGIALRLAPARNNQRRRVNWAEDYELAARLGHTGP